MLFLDISQFTQSPQAVLTNIKYCHSVTRGTLAGSSKTWICKEAENPALAASEYLAQEFFRTIIAHQPQTLLAKNSKTGIYYILSEEVEGYRELPLNQSENFNKGWFTGLGQVLVVSLFLEEIDLKNGNIGLDVRNQVIKIDGGWCFAENISPGKYPISPQAIEQLPYPVDFYAYNWLDFIDEGKRTHQGKIVDPAALSNSPSFKTEVNQALHRLILLPDVFIQSLVDCCISAGGQRFVDLIIRRRQQLMQSLLDNDSFNYYLKSPEARLNISQFFSHMASFEVGGLSIAKSYKLRLDCQSLIKELKTHLTSEDEVLLDFISKQENSLSTPHPDLYEIKCKLTKAKDAMTSPDVMSVKETIKLFRTHPQFLFFRDKGTKIEQAFYKTPLEKRLNLISSAEVNQVQLALS